MAAPGPRRMASSSGTPPDSCTPPDQRIGRIDALELDQRLLAAVGPSRHGAHGRGLADAALLPQPGALLALGRTVRTRQRDVSAQQRLALALEARAQRIGQRADAGDDGDAQRHAGDEDVEAPEPVALLAQRQAERQRQPGSRAPGAERRSQPPSCGGQLRAGDLRRPPCAPGGRSARRASRSWVTKTRVACRRRCRPNSRSITCSPVLPSRLPVGSSARMICGRGLSARAMATRCCSPPESCAGK